MSCCGMTPPTWCCTALGKWWWWWWWWCSCGWDWIIYWTCWPSAMIIGARGCVCGFGSISRWFRVGLIRVGWTVLARRTMVEVVPDAFVTAMSLDCAPRVVRFLAEWINGSVVWVGLAGTRVKIFAAVPKLAPDGPINIIWLQLPGSPFDEMMRKVCGGWCGWWPWSWWWCIWSTTGFSMMTQCWDWPGGPPVRMVCGMVAAWYGDRVMAGDSTSPRWPDVAAETE